MIVCSGEAITCYHWDDYKEKKYQVFFKFRSNGSVLFCTWYSFTGLLQTLLRLVRILMTPQTHLSQGTLYISLHYLPTLFINNFLSIWIVELIFYTCHTVLLKAWNLCIILQPSSFFGGKCEVCKSASWPSSADLSSPTGVQTLGMSSFPFVPCTVSVRCPECGAGVPVVTPGWTENSPGVQLNPCAAGLCWPADFNPTSWFSCIKCTGMYTCCYGLFQEKTLRLCLGGGVLLKRKHQTKKWVVFCRPTTQTSCWVRSPLLTSVKESPLSNCLGLEP
jgi:hypothetical protein